MQLSGIKESGNTSIPFSPSHFCKSEFAIFSPSPPVLTVFPRGQECIRGIGSPGFHAACDTLPGVFQEQRGNRQGARIRIENPPHKPPSPSSPPSSSLFPCRWFNGFQIMAPNVSGSINQQIQLGGCIENRWKTNCSPRRYKSTWTWYKQFGVCTRTGPQTPQTFKPEA